MNSKNKNNYKCSYMIEGESEKIVLDKLKTEIIENRKISLCKECNNKFSNICNGTISDKKIIEFKNSKCPCKKILIMDQDEIPDKKIKEYKKFSNNDLLIIISIPNIEIVLLSIFENITTKLDKHKIDKKLKQYFQIKFGNFKYKHGPKSVDKILNYLIENKSKSFKFWKENLNKLNELGLSNFIELINFLEQTKESNNK